MSVRIAEGVTDIAAVSGSAVMNEPAFLYGETVAGHQYYYWCGASGRRYLHSVYPLVECPQIPQANYILVRREADGSRIALRIGQTVEKANSLNLAYVRHISALAGANEVHVHMLAGTQMQRQLVEADLQAGLLSRIAPENNSGFSNLPLC